MSEPEGTSALARATRALQDEPEPGWPDLAERVSRRLRSVSRPGRPLVVQVGDAGTLRVDQRVLVDTVRRAVARVPGCRPVGVDVRSQEQEVTSLRVQVWARYGSDVRAVATDARAVAVGSLQDVLARPVPVDVDVVDVDVDVEGV
ncbi:hypothetical protein [Aquipuribacter sp. MA13-13]